MTAIPTPVAEQAELAWAEEPDCSVLWVNVAGGVWIVARDGRSASFAGPRADDEADVLARRWAKELGGSWKYAAELEALRRWREGGARPEDKPERWTVGIWRPSRRLLRPQQSPNLPDTRRCEASLSAESYKRHTPKAEFSQEKWQWLDAGHERCPNPTRKLRRTAERWVGLCGRHDPGDGGTLEFYPYLAPGPTCPQPCCRGKR